MSDEFERFLEQHARDYNPPPEPPTEEMWAAIRQQLPRRSSDDALDLTARRAARERRRRIGRFTPWAIGIAAAATLGVGFGLGRITQERAPATTPPGIAAAPAADEAPSASVRLAAADHLGEAEALLTFYRTARLEADRAATARWARELLSTTRMMMDARAGEDPALAMLLGDLELVLVQIVATGAEGGAELELIEESIEQRQLLTQLRTAASGPLRTSM